MQPYDVVLYDPVRKNVLATGSPVCLVGVGLMVLLAARMQPPGAEGVAYGFGIMILALMTLVSEVVALGLGAAGALQRRRKGLYAVLGIACRAS